MERDLPDIAKGGVLIEKHDPSREIRQVAEHNREWDFSTEVAHLYRRADTIVERLYPTIYTPHFQGRLPAPLVAIESLRNKNTLAAYRIVPDGYGLNFKLTFNEQHYIDGQDEAGNKTKVWRFGQWAQMETLVHELGHHWQQLMGDDPYVQNRRITHNKEFRAKMAELGIHCTPEGYHDKLADMDSPFGYLMQEWGIQPPKDVKKDGEFDIDWFKVLIKDRGKERKGKSTLRKYSCECGQNIRVGKKDWPGAVCNKCGSQYEERIN
jgi:hypothetical protein